MFEVKLGDISNIVIFVLKLNKTKHKVLFIVDRHKVPHALVENIPVECSSHKCPPYDLIFSLFYQV